MADFDTGTLLRCRAVSRRWRDVIDSRTALWSQMSLMRAVKENRLDICQYIVEYANGDPNAIVYKDYHTSLHIDLGSRTCMWLPEKVRLTSSGSFSAGQQKTKTLMIHMGIVPCTGPQAVVTLTSADLS